MKEFKEDFADRLFDKNLFMRVIPDPVLYKETQIVTIFDDKLKELLSDMRIFMHEYNGIGLSANQIGVSKRIAIVMPEDEKSIMTFINPKIISTSNQMCDFEEGCLSIPGIYYNVKRPDSIEIEYQDEQGNKKQLKAENLLARILFHEIDHLDGKVFIDHLSRLKKNFVENKFKKLQRI